MGTDWHILNDVWRWRTQLPQHIGSLVRHPEICAIKENTLRLAEAADDEMRLASVGIGRHHHTATLVASPYVGPIGRNAFPVNKRRAEDGRDHPRRVAGIDHIKIRA